MNIKGELQNIKTNYEKTIELIPGGTAPAAAPGQVKSAPLIFSQKSQIDTIEFYTNSRYLNGQRDELQREKPFFNILNGICDVENAAKDIDTKDIEVTSDDANHFLEAFLLSKDIQVWMKRINFGKFLNDLRDSDTRYGSSLVKKVIKNDRTGKRNLFLELPEWKNMMTDQVDIMRGAKVETHFMTAAELSDKAKVWKGVDKVLDLFSNQGSSKRIPVYEVRGRFPLSLYNETIADYNNEKYTSTKKDRNTFTEQLYYVAGNPVESGRFTFLDSCYVMYWENDTDATYKYKARKKRSGRAFGVGVFEEGEEAQVWTNDAVLKQYRAMEYSSKVIKQSASKKLKGRNLLTEADDGIILEHEEGKPISDVDLLPSGGLQQFPAVITQWYDQLQKTTSAYAAQRGEAPPSGTPYRLEAAIINQSNSVFNNLLEDLGIFVGELFDEWIIPFLSEQLNEEHILAYEFSSEELKEIDRNFSIRQANQKAAEMILSGEIVTQEQYDSFVKAADTFIKGTKGQRFIQIPKGFYKDLQAKVTVNITGEQKNKAAILESLNNIMITYGNLAKQGIDLTKDPVLSMIFGTILEQSGAGISPVAFNAAIAQKAKESVVSPNNPPAPAPTAAPVAQPQPLSLQANPT